jgi:hypothetical protein
MTGGIPEHSHPELERSIAEHYRVLQASINLGFDDLVKELRAGFGRINQRLDAHDARFERLDQRLDVIEAHLRRISPDGHQQ